MIVLMALVVTIATVVEGQKKYTDANRPYEFGFKIDGEQHRQEKKTEDGLIMGEFGFITGDGIYHVTVFATDENGNYKILSMKHIRVGPSPWGPAKSKTPVTTTTTTTTTTQAPKRENNKLSGKPGCSGCLIPTPPPPPGSKPKPPQFPGTPGFPATGGGGSSGRPGQFPGSSPGSPGSSAGRPGQFPGSAGNPGQFPGSAGNQGSRPGGSPGQFPGSAGNPGQFPGSAGNPGQFPGSAGNQGSRPGGSPGQFPSGQRPGSSGFGGASPGGPNKVTSGLPPGVTVDDVMGLLYKFNYTVGFHGHNELGYKNGNKDGEYFVNHRDGLKRIITYVADENGYQPKVKFVRLNDQDTPKAETEKEYGLKGYEFKWFNRR